MTAILSYTGDNDTFILNNIWANLDCKVITIGKDNVTRKDIDKAISEETDTLILAGHGSPDGLYGYGYGLGCKDFDTDYAVDEDNKDLIKAKNLICIWCYAADFGKQQNLKGFFSGMFISNGIEALLFNIIAQSEKIWQLERNFCDNLNELIRTNVPMDQWIGKLKEKSDHNDPVDIFNMDNLRYFD